MTVKAGLTFTHQSFLDPAWQPGPGQTYAADSPKAHMVVTHVTTTTVWYAYAPGPAKGAWRMDRDEFTERYAQ